MSCLLQLNTIRYLLRVLHHTVSLGESSFFLNQAKDIFVRVHICEKKKKKLGCSNLQSS